MAIPRRGHLVLRPDGKWSVQIGGMASTLPPCCGKPHDTAEEALTCFKAEGARIARMGAAAKTEHPCAECGDPTKLYLRSQIGGCLSVTWICEKHCTDREAIITVAKKHGYRQIKLPEA